MKKKITTPLRNKAERETIGAPAAETRKLYRQYKKKWREKFKKIASPKFTLSKRQKRKEDWKAKLKVASDLPKFELTLAK